MKVGILNSFSWYYFVVFTSERNNCGQPCVFGLFYAVFYFVWGRWVLINQPSKNIKQMEEMCMSVAKRLLSQATNSQTPSELGQPRLEAGQTRSTLLCSMLHRPVPSPAKSGSSGSVSIFYHVESLLSARRLCKKTN